MLEIRRFVPFQVDRKDVEPRFDLTVRKLPQVMSCQPPQYAALARIDSHLRWSDGAHGAGLDLDETQRIAVPRDQVEIARCSRGMPAARYDHVAAAHKPEKRGTLALDASSEVSGAFWTATRGRALQSIDRRLHEIHAKLEEHARYFQSSTVASQ